MLAVKIHLFCAPDALFRIPALHENSAFATKSTIPNKNPTPLNPKWLQPGGE
jgi:hypothetical protein